MDIPYTFRICSIYCFFDGQIFILQNMVDIDTYLSFVNIVIITGGFQDGGDETEMGMEKDKRLLTTSNIFSNKSLFTMLFLLYISFSFNFIA